MYSFFLTCSGGFILIAVLKLLLELIPGLLKIFFKMLKIFEIKKMSFIIRIFFKVQLDFQIRKT